MQVLPLDRGLNVLSETSESKEMKGVVQSILKSIREEVHSRRHSRNIRRFFQRSVNMIKAGEAGGVLATVLDKLNEFLESTKELKDNVVSLP